MLLLLWSRLRRIVTCIGLNQKNQPNVDLNLVRRYKICHFPIVVSYFCIGQNQKNQPNLALYLVRRYKIFVSVATLVVVLYLLTFLFYLSTVNFGTFHFSDCLQLRDIN